MAISSKKIALGVLAVPVILVASFIVVLAGQQLYRQIHYIPQFKREEAKVQTMSAPLIKKLPKLSGQPLYSSDNAYNTRPRTGIIQFNFFDNGSRGQAMRIVTKFVIGKTDSQASKNLRSSFFAKGWKLEEPTLGDLNFQYPGVKTDTSGFSASVLTQVYNYKTFDDLQNRAFGDLQNKLTEHFRTSSKPVYGYRAYFTNKYNR